MARQRYQTRLLAVGVGIHGREAMYRAIDRPGEAVAKALAQTLRSRQASARHEKAQLLTLLPSRHAAVPTRSRPSYRTSRPRTIPRI